MIITWLGHACFLLDSGGYRLLLDPYSGVRGFPDVRTEVHSVFCSHQHGDHFYVEGTALLPPRDNPFAVRKVASFHDDQQGRLRGGNTIHCCSAEGMTVVHLGDLGHQLSPEQVAEIGSCDVLLVPVGGIYTLDAAGAKAVTEALRPRITIPMHYRQGGKGLPVVAGVEDFLSLFPSREICRYPSSVLTITPDTPGQIAVPAVP